VFVKDIGLYGTVFGYTLIVGGRSDRNAQAGRVIAEKIPQEAVLPVARKIINYFQLHGKPGERLGQTINRCGFEDFVTSIGVD
jgi:dissimilatory sulfite reductase (desulfoviridin) alpha/beta subunit